MKEHCINPCLLLEAYKYKPIELVSVSEFYAQCFPEVTNKKTLRYLYEYIIQKTKLNPYFVISPDVVLTLSVTEEAFISIVVVPPARLNCYFAKSEEDMKLHYLITYIPQENKELRAQLKLLPQRLQRKKMRVFSKPVSVFKYWYEDTPSILAQAFKYDFERSKIPRIIKNQIEYKAIYDMLLKHYVYIKEEFTSIIVKSSYPYITWIDFTSYAQQKEILCKDFNLSTLDRLFITVNVGLDNGEIEGNPNRELRRSDFLEIIVRIGATKYKDTRKVNFLSDAVELFLRDLTSVGQPQGIHEFRVKKIWTLEMDDLLRANRDGIKKVFKRYAGMKCYLTLTEAKDLIMNKCKCDISEQELVKAYGYSKMTVKNEAERISNCFIKTLDDYNRMTEDEFMEFIVRIANVIYPKEPTLVERVDLLLIKLFVLVKAMKYPPYVPEETSEEEDDINNLC